MHKQRLFILVAAGVGVLSTLLPWIKVSFLGFSSTLSGLGVWGGWVFLGLCIAAAVMVLTQGDKTQELDAAAKKKIMSVTAGGAGFMLYFLFVKVTLSFAGMGIWLAVLAAIGMLAIPFVINGTGTFEMPTKDSIQADIKGTDDSSAATRTETSSTETASTETAKKDEVE